MALQDTTAISFALKVVGETSSFLTLSGSHSAQYDEYQTQLYKVADETTDQDIDLGTIASGKVLVILSDQVISAKLNGSSDDIVFKNLILTDTAITELSLSNDSGNDANVKIVVLGS